MTQAKLIPLFIIALSLALNLYGLSADSFWGDEILTATFAGRSTTDIIRWTAEDIHPPFYYLAAGAFANLTIFLGASDTNLYPNTASDWIWRFPSVLAGVLTIAMSYRLTCDICRRLPYILRSGTHLPQHTACYAALLLCVAPVAIKYGQEARMHSLFMLLSALSTWLFFRAIAHPQRRARWLAFALATTANIYTMYFGFFTLAAQAGFLVCDIVHRQLRGPKCLANSFIPDSVKVKGFTASMTLVFLLYLPWWPVLLTILRKRAATGAIEGGVGAPAKFIAAVVDALGPVSGWPAWIFLGFFIVGLLFLVRSYWPMAIFAFLWLALPALLPILLGDPRALQFRYAFILPVYLLIVAYSVIYLSHLNRFRASQPQNWAIATYLIWLLITFSVIGVLDGYRQVKPDWRRAAAYLDERTGPTDIILIGPLWDEGRFIDYYYRGQAQLLTPAAMVTNIERRAEEMRTFGGSIWAVNRFAPQETPVMRNVAFSGVVISEPQLSVYEPSLLMEATIGLAAQAVEAAYPWAAEAEAQGVLDPDPRTAQAAALRAWGDTLMAAGRPEEALQPYQTAVDIFPGWVNGFIALAEAHKAAGNLPAAAAAYQQAISFNLSWQGAEADEAAALVQAGRWKSAIEKYHLIIGE